LLNYFTSYNRPARFFVIYLILPLLLAIPGLAIGGVTRFLPDDTITEIRAKIEANGYSFTVAPNWVTRLPAAEKQHLFSRRRSSLSSYHLSSSTNPGPLLALSPDGLPEQFDWRDYQGHSYIGPVRDQGSCGACYAFGACAAAEGVYNVARGLYDGECIDFSEAFLAFCLDQYYDGFSGCLGSSYDYEELDALVEQGVCLETAYPYHGFDEGCIPGVDSAPRVKVDEWYRIPCDDITAIKTAILTYGVVDAAVDVSSAFQYYDSGIFNDGMSGCDADPDPCYYAKTNHCIALVGWNDNGGDGYWILRNSWGEDWGEDGYMRITYNAAHVSCAVCYLVPLGQISGMKWNDYNSDGVRDLEEPGLSFWRVYADINDNRTWDPGEPYAITNQEGKYTLDLSSGAYVIAEEQQSGWTQTFPGGNVISRSSGDGVTHTVVLGGGGSISGVSFGNHGPAAVMTVKIDWPEPVYHNNIQNAYNEVFDGNRVEIQIGNYNENLLFDKPVSINLSSGYNDDFSDKVGWSNLIGTMTISNGRVTVERLRIQ